jgi:hypothetical protein
LDHVLLVLAAPNTVLFGKLVKETVCLPAIHRHQSRPEKLAARAIMRALAGASG